MNKSTTEIQEKEKVTNGIQRESGLELFRILYCASLCG